MSLKLPSAEQLLFVANIIADKLFFKQKYDPTVKEILIVKWDEIGDMATATHVFKLIKENYPDAAITVLCKPFVKSLILHDPNLYEIITDVKACKKRYDLVVELRGTWRTLFNAFWFKSRYRVGRAEVRASNKGKQLHEIDTNSAIVKPVLKNGNSGQLPALYFTESDTKVINKFLQIKYIKRFAIFHVGARRILRQWPLNRFATIAEFLHKEYQLDIVFAGTAEDKAEINKVQDVLKFETFTFIDGFSLSEFACLCSKASFYVGNESGPLQIASVFDVPLVGIFGPGVPDVFYPKGKYSRIVHHVLQCNPCNQIDCVQPNDPCIKRVTVLEVLDAISAINASFNLK